MALKILLGFNSTFLEISFYNQLIIAVQEFFNVTKNSENVVCHFYREETFRCKIMDKHLAILAKKHVETKFCKVIIIIDASSYCPLWSPSSISDWCRKDSVPLWPTEDQNNPHSDHDQGLGDTRLYRRLHRSWQHWWIQHRDACLETRTCKLVLCHQCRFMFGCFTFFCKHCASNSMYDVYHNKHNLILWFHCRRK